MSTEPQMSLLRERIRGGGGVLGGKKKAGYFTLMVFNGVQASLSAGGRGGEGRHTPGHALGGKGSFIIFLH